MSDAATVAPMPASFRAMAIGSVAHAVLLLCLWSIVVFADTHVVPARLWLALAWLWLAWPIALALHPARTARRLVATLLIGLVILLPCVQTIYVLTSWSITGFAP